jgi:membrane protein DedA with SNARE-associated domain
MTELITRIGEIAAVMPLPAFVFWASLIEEIISSIPSPFGLITGGILAKSQGIPVYNLLWLSVLASLGKTIGSWPFYELTYRGEKVLTGRFGKLLGVSHNQVERIGAYFDKSNKGSLIIFALRAFPFGPSLIVSLVCGFIKVNRRKYLQMTFIGYFVRSFIFLYLGYAGLLAYNNGIGEFEAVISSIFALVLILTLAYVFYLRRRGRFNNLFGVRHEKRK